jgi:predicted lipoprotein with Yx(FWY)xxD motif
MRHRLIKQTHILLAGLLIAGASLAAVAGAQGSSAHTSRTSSVEARHTKIGSILTTVSGFTVYTFTRDHGSSNSCIKIKGCAEEWPALETKSAPVAGPGVKASLLSTINLTGGAKQITYAGRPLYLFADDTSGETDYVDETQSGGQWPAINASGGSVK